MDKKSNPFFPGAGLTRETLYRKHLTEKRRRAFIKSPVYLLKNFINTTIFLFVFKITGLIKMKAADILLYPMFWAAFLFAVFCILLFIKARKES